MAYNITACNRLLQYHRVAVCSILHLTLIAHVPIQRFIGIEFATWKGSGFDRLGDSPRPGHRTRVFKRHLDLITDDVGANLSLTQTQDTSTLPGKDEMLPGAPESSPQSGSIVFSPASDVVQLRTGKLDKFRRRQRLK
jgi:hypothetical protein